MLLMGIDLGTSAVKISVLNASSGNVVCRITYPETERIIISEKPGFAEQDPLIWWQDVQQAIRLANQSGRYDPHQIEAIGIAYQMHGLVALNEQYQPVCNSIIWCDSRAIETGREATNNLGSDYCLTHLLNLPGNFTASKLGWLKQNIPECYNKIQYWMLPGDYIAGKLTGEFTTTTAALSEGVCWDFRTHQISSELFNYFGFNPACLPPIQPVFSNHGFLSTEISQSLGLRAKIPVSYKAGDQQNNALSLNVLAPGEVAATAGTSGVIYSVTDQLIADPGNRINSFAHVNHTKEHPRIGSLLCLNGAGSLNRWIRSSTGAESYESMNLAAGKVPPGSEGLLLYPFGNGAERMLGNRIPNASFLNLDFNRHQNGHLFRAAQEGISFAFRYGLGIMNELQITPNCIRAGWANLFRSELFQQIFADTLQLPVELYDTDGATGAAMGAGIGAGIFTDAANAFKNRKQIHTIVPNADRLYEPYYQHWKQHVEQHILHS